MKAIKNWRTTLGGVAVAMLTAAGDGVDIHNANFWINMVVAGALVLAKDAQGNNG